MDQFTFGLISITRRFGAQYLEREGNVNILTEDVLAICLPFGNNFDESIKLKFYNEVFFFSIVKIISDNEGIGIICAFESINELFVDNFNYFNKILEILDSKMKFVPDFTNQLINSYLDWNILTEIENIECGIISLLLNKKVYVIDYKLQSVILELALLNLLPLKFHKYLDFTLNSTSLAENTRIQIFQHLNTIKDQLNNFNQENATIIDLTSKNCFGIYASPIFSLIIKKLRENKLEEAKIIFENIEKLIFANETFHIKMNNFPNNIKITKGDIRLLKKIKLTDLNLPLQNNLFEELVK